MLLRLVMKFHAQSGIAIGPILFVIAILAILAAAIAAGSGSFMTGTSQESANTLASTLMTQADQVKSAVTYLLDNGCDETQLNFAYTQNDPYLPAWANPVSSAANLNAPSDGSCDVFSVKGGMPVVPMPPVNIALPTSTWYLGYWTFSADFHVAGVGSGNNLLVMATGVTQAVCQKINAINGISGIGPDVFGSHTIQQFTGSYNVSYSPTLNAQLTGQLQGCYNDNGRDSSGLWVYYSVLLVR